MHYVFGAAFALVAVNCTPAPSDGPGGSSTGGTNGSASGGKGGSNASGGKTGSGGSGSGGAAGAQSSGGAPGTGGSPSTGSGGSPAGTGGAGAGGSADAGSGAGGATPGGDDAGGGGAPVSGDKHPACPNCKSLFDGKTLTGWKPVGAEKWAVDNGKILSTGAAAGVLITDAQYDHYRLIYSWKMLAADGHQANMVIFCRNEGARYCGGVQFQPPGTDIWDYGPANKSLKGAAMLMKAPVEKGEAGQCEMIVNATAGTFKVACCNLGTGSSCKGTPVGMLNYGKVAKGAFGWQAHNPDHKIHWWNIFLEENPTSDDFVTTK